MRNQKIYKLTILAILMAIIMIQTVVPWIGYIKILPIWPAIVTIPITVTFGAIVLGPKGGFVLGLFWGILAWWQALISPDPLSQLVFINPIISIVPRIFVGLVAAYLFKVCLKKLNIYWSSLIASGLGTITNTVLVYILTVLFYQQSARKILDIMGMSQVSVKEFLITLGTVFGSNGILEMILTMIVVPILVIAVKKIKIK